MKHRLLSVCLLIVAGVSIAPGVRADDLPTPEELARKNAPPPPSPPKAEPPKVEPKTEPTKVEAPTKTEPRTTDVKTESGGMCRVGDPGDGALLVLVAPWLLRRRRAAQDIACR
jgi:MYXO-CTERM domain-containing protein